MAKCYPNLIQTINPYSKKAPRALNKNNTHTHTHTHTHNYTKANKIKLLKTSNSQF